MGRVGKVGHGLNIDEGKNPQSLLLFVSPHVSFALVAYNLTCSPLSKRLEQVRSYKYHEFLSFFFFKMEEDMSKEVTIIFVDSFLKLGTQFFI